jgi:hypothetical protein
MVTVDTMQLIIAVLSCSTFTFAVVYVSTKIDATDYRKSCEVYHELWDMERRENQLLRLQKLQKKRHEKEGD